MIDSHAHLTSDVIYPIVDEVLQRALEAGIKTIVNICTDIETLERGLKLSEKYPWVKNAAATTPHDAATVTPDVFETIASCSDQLVAIGETGLEYHYYPDTKKQQQKLFIQYLHLAQEKSLPIIIHCRDAFRDFFSIIDQEYSGQGVLHCFTGTPDDAEQLIKRGWYISLSGIATYKRSESLREVALAIPLEKLLIETDAPYLAPQGYRGKQNEPSYIRATAECLAGVRGIPVNEFIEATASNARNFFGA